MTGQRATGSLTRTASIYLPKGLCGKPVIAISHDEGATWEQVTIAERPEFPVDRGTLVTGHESGLAIDAAGNLYYTWPGKDLHVYLSVSQDRGESWSRPVDVTPPGVTRDGAPGHRCGIAEAGIAMTFAGTRARQRLPAEETTWDGYVVISKNALGPRPAVLRRPDKRSGETTPCGRGHLQRDPLREPW